MIILSIETSCDETAVSLVHADGGLEAPIFHVLGNALYSQVALHTEYGGVYPNLAKREHSKNLVPILTQALTQAGVLETQENALSDNTLPDNSTFGEISTILEREGGLEEETVRFLKTYKKPAIDIIAVTAGPGLEPALWVGISFAKALGLAWGIPVVPTNHMKGHIASVLMHNTPTEQKVSLPRPNPITFPALSLLISGGHTELVLARSWSHYEVLGQTRDDAVGEAFDKVARMLSLPYPGGPQISLLAAEARKNKNASFLAIKLPRPMIHSNDLDFSFSGLKTAVLYTIRDLSENHKPGGVLTDAFKMDIAHEFEDAVVDVLVAKTRAALDQTGAETLIIAGGVIANTRIREAFRELIDTHYPYVSLFIPEKELATDNALMIACAAYLDITSDPEKLASAYARKDFRAEGNMKF